MTTVWRSGVRGRAVPTMVADARHEEGASRFLPSKHSLNSLQRAAARCQGCDLYRDATQTVFGDGVTDAPMMLVGEQPGDREDREGAPFVGPAGRVLASALERAEIDRQSVYVTNAVKHFKFVPRGKKRIHRRPELAEINACRPWLDAELEVIRPRVLVCLGATAAQALLGRDFRVTRQRGVPVDSPLARTVLATVHPASILRSTDRSADMDAFVADLVEAGKYMHLTHRA
jgi:uracil-DNA glycosylase family protein